MKLKKLFFFIFVVGTAYNQLQAVHPSLMLRVCALKKVQNKQAKNKVTTVAKIQEMQETVTLLEYMRDSKTYKNIVRGAEAIIINIFAFLV